MEKRNMNFYALILGAYSNDTNFHFILFFIFFRADILQAFIFHFMPEGCVYLRFLLGYNSGVMKFVFTV
jgi:hypothetical protein